MAPLLWLRNLYSFLHPRSSFTGGGLGGQEGERELFTLLHSTQLLLANNVRGISVCLGQEDMITSQPEGYRCGVHGNLGKCWSPQGLVLQG